MFDELDELDELGLPTDDEPPGYGKAQLTADFPDVLEFLQAKADDELWEAMAAFRPKRVRKPRKQTLASTIKQAEKAGKNVTSITTAEGVTLSFDQPKPTEASNPWLADLDKVTKQ